MANPHENPAALQKLQNEIYRETILCARDDRGGTARRSF
jgi:hypothetical protein